MYETDVLIVIKLYRRKEEIRKKETKEKKKEKKKRKRKRKLKITFAYDSDRRNPFIDCLFLRY